MNKPACVAGVVLLCVLFGLHCGSGGDDPAGGGALPGGACRTDADCDDGNVCTRDVCFESACVYRDHPADLDGDGYVDAACGGTDCDDRNRAVHPGVPEAPYDQAVCADGRDNNCNGFVDGEDAGCRPCATAADCDDGNPCTTDRCVGDGCAYVLGTGACDDGDPCTMEDRCGGNGVCEGVPTDADGDGYVSAACGGTDCDDGNANVNVGAREGPYQDVTCADRLDNDCDGGIDTLDDGCQPCERDADCFDGDVCTVDVCTAGRCSNTWAVVDGDGDGYGNQHCGGTDCDDADPEISPAAVEGPPGDATCTDLFDNDCDGRQDGQDPGCAAGAVVVPLRTDARVATNASDIAFTLEIGSTQTRSVNVRYSGVAGAIPSPGEVLVETVTLGLDAIELSYPFLLWRIDVALEEVDVLLAQPVQLALGGGGAFAQDVQLVFKATVTVSAGAQPIVQDLRLSVTSDPVSLSGAWTSAGDTNGNGVEEFDLGANGDLRFALQLADVPVVGAVGLTVSGALNLGMRGEPR